MPVLNTSSDTVEPVLIIDRFGYAYPGAEDFTLRDVSLRIEPGECHLLEGLTGSGKSTLLKAIRGLLPPGRRTGSITLPARTTASLSGAPGLVQQNPAAQLLCTNLGAEIAFGLENHCIDPKEMAGRAETALRQVGLNRPLTIPVDTLSMGQQYRACIAGQLVMEPLLVMLDEPVAQLDPRGREKTLEVIRQLKRSGRAVLICEHRAEFLREVVDRFWRIDETGCLRELPGPPPSAGNDDHGEPPAGAPAHGSAAESSNLSPVIELRGLKFTNRHSELDLSSLDLVVGKGQCIALCGANGSGKTTLIRAIAGLVDPAAGSVKVFGKPSRIRDVRGRLSVLFQDPAKQLFEATVFDEVAFSARRGMADKASVDTWVTTLLKELGLEPLTRVSPHRLSYGQKHLIGLAAVLAGRPEILLLDDPFAGLDRERAASVRRLVAKISRERGMTVLWTTHDPDHLTDWADRVVEIAADRRQGVAGTAQPAPSETDSAIPSLSRRCTLPTGILLSLCMLLSMLAFAARSATLLAALAGINLLLLLLCSQEPFRLLKKSGILLVWQAGFVVVLYVIRFGVAEGLAPGGRVALQLFLAFWPGMIFMSANSQPRIVRTLAKVLPQRVAFVSATCLRFLPMLLAEMQRIREAQILRGARIMVRDLKEPKFWPDWILCLAIPTLIKTLSLADEIATAATARDFGIHPGRTAWPGD